MFLCEEQLWFSVHPVPGNSWVPIPQQPCQSDKTTQSSQGNLKFENFITKEDTAKSYDAAVPTVASRYHSTAAHCAGQLTEF